MINRLLPILITSVLLAGCTKTETTKGGIAQEMELAKTCWRCDNVFLSSGYCPVMIFWERIGNTHCSMYAYSDKTEAFYQLKGYSYKIGYSEGGADVTLYDKNARYYLGHIIDGQLVFSIYPDIFYDNIASLQKHEGPLSFTQVKKTDLPGLLDTINELFHEDDPDELPWD